MGAILAIMGEAGDPELPERLEKMIARSPYRGQPIRHFEGGLALAVQTRGWDASLTTVGNWTVAFHGIIGNWNELSAVHGWHFPEESTSATKLATAFEQLGDRFFTLLRGEFAILIFDRASRQVTTARDLWARRPLFVTSASSRLYFASEIRQILAGTGLQPRIDRNNLIQELLWVQSDPTKTHVNGIEKIESGSVVRFKPGTKSPVDSNRFWTPPIDTIKNSNEADLTNELRYLIDQAVGRWMQGVPFAVSLSGGIDSSTIWSSISRKQAQGDSNAQRGRPFSFIVPGTDFDEGPQIRRILQATDSEGVFLDRSDRDVVNDLFQNAEKIDSPYHGIMSSVTPLNQLIRRDNRELLLDGGGGDMLMEGSTEYFLDLLRENQIFQALRDLRSHETYAGESRVQFILRTTVRPTLRPYLKGLIKRRTRKPPTWVHESVENPYSEIPNRDVSSLSSGGMHRHQIGFLRKIKMESALARRDAAEQLSESEGIVRGSPLVDIDILNFAWRLPPRAFSQGVRYKQLLRNVAYDGLGQSIREWFNPEPGFSLKPGEVEKINQLMPPGNWSLVSDRIIDLEQVESLIRRSVHDDMAGYFLSEIFATELVVRNLLASEVS